MARWLRLPGAVGLAVVLLAGACSSSDDASGGEGAGGAGTGAGDQSCEQEPTVDPVVSEPVDGVPSDLTVTSFDGTPIRVHWFPVADAGADGDRAPTVLVGPGWGQAGATEDGGSDVVPNQSPLAALRDAGYNVLTWDPRGFGESGGRANVNDPAHEGRDMQVLLDWVATRPETLLDRAGDPRAGMVGASYGGGIQLVLAGIDCRVDALVPTIAWHSLVTSLYPRETARAGWTELLNLAVTSGGGTAHPMVVEGTEQALSDGVLDPEVVDWFDARGPGDLVEQISAPTLLVHGTTDTLFPPSEAVANFRALRDAGTPVAMLWVCEGHGICLTERGDPDTDEDRTVAWLDRHLKGEDVDTGPVVDILDQDGRRWSGDDYPDEPDTMLHAEGDGGTLSLTRRSHAGPATVPDAATFEGFVTDITPARAERAIELTLAAEEEALVLGAPRATITYRGTAPDGRKPVRVFAQLVDGGTGHVLGNQIVPVPLTLDGEERTVEVDLEVVAHHLEPGDAVTLQLVATTPAFAEPRLGGELTVTDLALDLPVTGSLSPSSPTGGDG